VTSVLSDLLRKAAIGHPDGERAEKLADEFDAAVEGWSADPQTVTPKRFLGCWARARRLYSEMSGEPLI
jgi:hypothetical protein